MLKRNGTLFTIKYLKQSRLLVTRYLCGRPIFVNESFVSTYKGFPKKFLFLKKFIDSKDVDKIRFCLTLFNISKAITPKRNESFPLDISTITKPGPEKFYTIPTSFVKLFIKEFSLKFPNINNSEKDFEINLKAGPHGPSSISVASTVRFLTDKQIEYMRTLSTNSFVDNWIIPVRDSMKEDFPVIPNGMESESNNANGLPIPKYTSCSLTKHELTGKLSVVHDAEAKERIIAISDYYSQIILKHYHNVFMNNLKLLPCDRTYTQDPFHTWTGKDPFYSLDLSAATDRFPVELQRKLLEYLLPFDGNKNREVSEAWKNLLVDREYLNVSTETVVKYTVGQPMGSYSSWAAFTLTHHLVVQWAAYLCGKYPFSNYILLGDDIVIRDSEVSKRYLKIMRRLGVSISPHKTHVSKNTYEFAKRWIRYIGENVVELSPLPIKGIATNYNNPFILFSIIYNWMLRTSPITKSVEIVNCLIVIFKGLTFKEPDPNFLKFSQIIKKEGGSLNEAKATLRLLGYREYITTHYNSSFLRDRLNLFKSSMRLSLGLMTEDEGRLFLLNLLPEGLDGVGLSRGKTITVNGVNRVLSIITMSQLKSSERKIAKIPHTFETYFRMYGKPMRELRLLPLFQGITNWILDLEEVIDKINPSHLDGENITPDDVNINIFNLYKRINFIDMDKLVSLHRNFHSDMVTNAMLWVKLRKILKGMRLSSVEHMATEIWPNSYELDIWLNMAYKGLSSNYKTQLFVYNDIKSSYTQLQKTTNNWASTLALLRQITLKGFLTESTPKDVKP